MRDFLNQILHGVHNVDMMVRLYHLAHLLEGTHGMEHLQMRPDHLSSIYS